MYVCCIEMLLIEKICNLPYKLDSKLFNLCFFLFPLPVTSYYCSIHVPVSYLTKRHAEAYTSTGAPNLSFCLQETEKNLQVSVHAGSWLQPNTKQYTILLNPQSLEVHKVSSKTRFVINNLCLFAVTIRRCNCCMTRTILKYCCVSLRKRFV